MSGKKVSRNAPCPCGSGKKFKHCCYGKGIDWSERDARPRRPVLPSLPARGPESLGFYGPIDRKLRAIAAASPVPAPWKALAERLTEATPLEERMRAYQAVREAKAVPDEASEFLISHAIQWIPDLLPAESEDEEEPDEETFARQMDESTLPRLRQYGGEELAELFRNNRLEYDRRQERGRQFFFGPPDKEFARHLKVRGVID